MLLDLGSELETTEVVSAEALRELRSEWADLWQRCPDATAFQSPDWAIAWWEYFGAGQLWIQLFWMQSETGRRLVGVAPLFIRRDEGGRRRVLLLGTGVTDYLDVIAEPALAPRCMAGLFTRLAASANLWDECDFHQLRPGANLLEAELSAEWLGSVAVQEVCPVLTLPASGPVPGRLVPGQMLAKAANYHRLLVREYDSSIELARDGNFEELFTAFLRLLSSRMIQGEPSLPSLQAFHYEVASQFLRRGVLRLYALRLGTRIVAALCTFLSGRKAVNYLGCADAQYQSLRPGTILIGHAIEQAVLEGAVEFDFLRGRETYKYLWGAKGRLNCRRRLSLLR